MKIAALMGLFSILVTACAPGSIGPGSSSAPPAASPVDNRTLVIGMKAEPLSAAPYALIRVTTGVSGQAPAQLFHAGLTKSDDLLVPRPHLVEALPRLGTDSWKVFPDGTMELTWQLRPSLTWHDGAPLVADDFVLSWKVTTSDEWKGASGSGVRIVEMTAPSERTLVERWNGPSPTAGESGRFPMPTHVLGRSWGQVSVDAFASLPWWRNEFVGLGPFRLEHWEPGSFIEATASPSYVAGKPKIARVQVVFIPDANTAVANLLSGSLHFATDETVGFDQASILRRGWAARGETGSVLLAAVRTRYVQIQYKPEYTNPAAIYDLRVRQALAHAIDKQALVDGVLDGEPGMADVAASPKSEYYAELDRAITKYPLDLRRSEQLMTTAGYPKGGDGFYGQDGMRLSLGLMAFSQGSGEKEALILADSWKQAGFETPLTILSATQSQDVQIVSTYPALRIDQTGIDGLTGSLSKWGESTISTPQNRWAGANRGGYYDPEYERLYQIARTSLDRNDRNQAMVGALKYLSDRAIYFPLYQGYLVAAHTGNVLGATTGDAGVALWNVEGWHWK